ncbi:MAG: N-acetylmuramic acid 6-phosphate etherase [Anaerolineaceae bacterium]|nr:N-acetylmuramic acid 6-phosphate etherase [Anaerolineaceae bacterium]
MQTEQQNPRSMQLDQSSTLDVLRIMNEEDQKVALVVQDALPQIAAAVDVIAERMGRGGRLFYVGAGTSGRLGVLDAVECVPTFGTEPEQVQGLIAGGDRAFVRAVEGAEDSREQGALDLKERHLSADDAVVGIAASGRTPYVLGALAYAREVGAANISIACNVPSAVLDAADYPIPLPVGPEALTGSTRLKAGTAQKLALNMLSTATMVKLGKVYGNLMVDVKVTNEKLVHRARRILMQLTGVDEAEAIRLLAATDQHVKTAAVMYHRGVDAAAARDLLAEKGGHLRAVIGSV